MAPSKVPCPRQCAGRQGQQILIQMLYGEYLQAVFLSAVEEFEVRYCNMGTLKSRLYGKYRGCLVVVPAAQIWLAYSDQVAPKP